jgi:hypothetical protein
MSIYTLSALPACTVRSHNNNGNMDIYNANNDQTMYPKPKLSIYTPRAPRPVDIAYQEAIIKQKKLEEKSKLQQPKPDQNKSEHDALIRGFLHLAHILLTSTNVLTIAVPTRHPLMYYMLKYKHRYSSNSKPSN